MPSLSPGGSHPRQSSPERGRPEPSGAIRRFQGLSDDVLARLAAAGIRVRVEPGRWLAGSAGVPATGWYRARGESALIVGTGSAVGLALGGDGRLVGTGLYPAGAGSVATAACPSAGGLRGLEPGTALVVPGARLEPLLRSDPAIAAAVARACADEAAQARRCLAWATLLDARGRTAAWLGLLAERVGRPQPPGVVSIGARLSQDDLAAMTGLSRETVNRALRSLVAEGLVGLRRRRYVVPDLGALLALTEA
jgi:CRP/FNR family transcriptional regulator, cyclic AMP receptor protein